MISRPLTSFVAGTLLLVGTAIAVYVCLPPRHYSGPLVISVQVCYPGANAATVAETVAAAIEQQVHGVEQMLSMVSQSSNDGSYALQVTFKPGTDLDGACVLMQDRVGLAIPVLPVGVQRESISVRRQLLEPVVLVGLTSPDPVFLGRLSALTVKNDLARLPGVGDVVVFGQRDLQVEVALDAAKLAALQLTAHDVVAAITEQEFLVAGGSALSDGAKRKGQEFQLSIYAPGQFAELEQLERIIVKAAPDGQVVRLQDVARVERCNDAASKASLNGKPVVVLAIHPLPNVRPRDASRIVREALAAHRAHGPEGQELAVAFDFAPTLEYATPEHLVIDVEPAESASAERAAAALNRATDLLSHTPGVQDVLALTEHPFAPVRKQSCLVVGLNPNEQRKLGRDQLAANVRAALRNDVPEAAFRVSVPSSAEGFPVYGFPIEFVIEDRGDRGTKVLRERAQTLVEKMSQSGKFSDASVGSGLRHEPLLTLEIDRTKCMALGVEIGKIFNLLQVSLGPSSVNNFNQFGPTWKVRVPADPRFRERAADLLKRQVKNKENQLVRLGSIVVLRDEVGPMVIERHNLCPIARITANLAANVSVPEAKALAETLTEQEFGTKQFRSIWRDR